MDGWNTSFLLGWPIFRCELLVSGRVLPLNSDKVLDPEVFIWLLGKISRMSCPPTTLVLCCVEEIIIPSYTGIIIIPYCTYILYIYISYIVGMSYVTRVLDNAHMLSGISWANMKLSCQCVAALLWVFKACRADIWLGRLECTGWRKTLGLQKMLHMSNKSQFLVVDVVATVCSSILFWSHVSCSCFTKDVALSLLSSSRDEKKFGILQSLQLTQRPKKRPSQ